MRIRFTSGVPPRTPAPARRALALAALALVLAPGTTSAAPIPVWGKVYLDANANGAWDPETEPGIADVGATNGTGIVFTQVDGTFVTGLDLVTGRLVWITVPSGYRATTKFYQKIHMSPGTDSLYFGLVPDPSLVSGPFTFAQISDSEIPSAAAAAQLAQDLAELTAARPSPAFIVATGDLVVNGDRDLFGLFRQVTSSLTIPVHNVYGNHDAAPGPIPTIAFEDSLGPSYYSFDHFGCHFVVVNSMNPPAAQDAWLPADLALLGGPGKPLFILRHSPPSRAELDLYQSFGAIAVLSGHWHVNSERRYRGILDITTPPVNFAGIDRSPRGFRLIHVSDTGITTEYRVGGQARTVTVVSPQAGKIVPRAVIPIRVNAYDTSIPAASVKMTFAGPGGGAGMITLAREGSRSWAGLWNASTATPGAWRADVTVTGEDGATWLGTSFFQVGDIAAPSIATGAGWPLFHVNALHQGAAAEEVTPPLAPAWITWTGGETGLSSPVVRNGMVYVGTGKGDSFSQCGVRAYDAATGALRWQQATSSSVTNTVAADGLAVVAVTVMGQVKAWQPVTGSPRWSTPLGDTTARFETSSPTTSGSLVFAGRAPHMEAISLVDGWPAWVAPSAGSDFMGNDYPAPAVSAGRAVFGTNSGLICLNTTDGSTAWSEPGYFRSATIRDSVVYAVGGTVFASQFLSARNLVTGAVYWTSPIDLANGGSSPAVTATTLVVGTGTGEVRAFDPADGAPRWSFATGFASAGTRPYVHSGPDVVSSPAISGSTVYVGATDGFLYALDVDSGALKWAWNLGASVRGSPAVSGNAVYVTADDGCLYAFAPVQTATTVEGGAGEAGTTPGAAGLTLRSASPLAMGGRIQFAGPAGATLRLELVDVTGRAVRALFRGTPAGGAGAVTWDGRDDGGHRLAPGVYFAVLEAGHEVTRTKIVITGG